MVPTAAPRALVCTLLLAVVTALAAVPVSANHAQSLGGKSVLFDHRSGTEWWVDVAVAGTDSATVLKVEAMDSNSAWTTLSKRSWGSWAGSFHIEPGNLVRFRATWSNGVQVASCWFTHPTGAERCDLPAGGFDATFRGVEGNQWWVQSWVSANRPLSAVQFRVDCGTWMPLALQGWGGWAASPPAPIPSGAKVDLRAIGTDGSRDGSAAYMWPAATATAGCGTSPYA